MVSNDFEILIVEDEPNLRETLEDYLSSKGQTCYTANSCKEAHAIFADRNKNPQIILMDIGLPDGDGISLAKELKELKSDFVLLFLSAQNDPETKYLGLEMGAEDYITKPFDLRELMLRLRKAISTHGQLLTYSQEISIGKLKIRFKSYEVVDAQGKIIQLGQKECAMLELLYQNKNIVVSRDEIIEKIWGEDAFPSNRTVDNYIVRLRKWLETDPSGEVSIKSIRGVGYQLQASKE